MEEQTGKKVIGGFAWKLAERLTAQIVTFGVSVVLARLLTPEHFGAVSLIMVFITLANVFVSNGFGNSLIQKKDADSLDFSSVFYFNMLFSAVVYIVIFLFAPAIANFYGMQELCPAIRVLAIRIPVAGINSVQHAYVSRNFQFRKFFFSTLGGTVVSAVVGVILAYCGCGIWALVAQYLTNTVTDTIVLWFTVKWRPRLEYSHRRMLLLFRYGWKLMIAGFLDTGYTQLRSLVIGKMYSSADLAYYNNGDKIPSLIATNINSSISSVLFPVLSKEQDKPELVREHTRKSIRIMSYILWPIMLGVVACAEPLVRILLTEKWLPAVPYLQIACFVYGLWPIHTANLEAMKAIGRSDLFLKLEIIKKTIGIIVLIAVMRFGVFAIAVSAIFTGISSTVINSYPNRKILKYSYWEQVKDFGPSFLLSSGMSLLVYCISFFIKNDYVLLVAQISAGICIYVLGSLLFKMDSLKYLLKYVKALFMKMKR